MAHDQAAAAPGWWAGAAAAARGFSAVMIRMGRAARQAWFGHADAEFRQALARMETAMDVTREVRVEPRARVVTTQQPAGTIVTGPGTRSWLLDDTGRRVGEIVNFALDIEYEEIRGDYLLAHLRQHVTRTYTFDMRDVDIGAVQAMFGPGAVQIGVGAVQIGAGTVQVGAGTAPAERWDWSSRETDDRIQARERARGLIRELVPADGLRYFDTHNVVLVQAKTSGWWALYCGAYVGNARHLLYPPDDPRLRGMGGPLEWPGTNWCAHLQAHGMSSTMPPEDTVIAQILMLTTDHEADFVRMALSA